MPWWIISILLSTGSPSERTKKFELLEKVVEAGRRVDVINIRQRQALGLGHAILTARSIVGNEPFAILLGDDIVFSEKSP